MHVIAANAIETLALPGLSHQTLAGPRDGLRAMEVWSQSIAPSVSTPVHRHACEEVIVVLSGTGSYHAEGRSESFGPGSTIIIPPGVVHQIVNDGTLPLQLVAALGAAPVTVQSADGERIHLPWDQHDLAATR